jgi:type IV pilus assembly protein PilP
MKKYQSDKLVKQPLLSRGSVVCLLIMTLWSGGATAEVLEALPAQNNGEVSSQPVQTGVKTQPDQPQALTQQNQLAVQTQQLQTTDELAAAEEENTKVAKALEELLLSMKMGDFEYQVEERPDPFMPFISEKIIQSSESESEGGGRLTGMRQLEPGQLSLVAILFTEINPMAMVEDSSQKGYVIRRGTRIGKFGIVTDILPNAVIIKQLSYSMSQEKKYTTVEMILRKEGEK